MSWQTRATRWLARNEPIIDAAVVVTVALTAVLFTAFRSPQGSEQAADWVAYALVLLAPVTLWWRRSKPLVVLPVALALVFIYWIFDYAGSTDLVLFTVFYSATRHGGPDRRRVWQVVGVALLAVSIVATIGVIVPTEDLPAIAVLGLVFIHGTAAAIGEALYQRSQYVAELEQRTAALEADVANQAALAAVEERTRIAREMHDIVAHGMSAIVVQAQGAQRLVDADPDRAREVLGTIETIGRTSVDDMRRMLGVLRDADGDAVLEPQPGLDDLAALARRVEEAGVALMVEVVGERRPLPPGVELTTYRVVQEALTNVMRHAGRPVRAEVRIMAGREAVEIEVRDDGLGAAASSATVGGGHGHLGMSERVEVYDGTFAAGPRPGGGYEVRAKIMLPAQFVQAEAADSGLSAVEPQDPEESPAAAAHSAET